MKKSRMLLVGITAAFLALAIGAGYASAQDQPEGQAATGEFQGPGPRRGHLAAGEVVKIEDGTITIKTLKDGTEKSFKVDDQTRYRKDGADATIDDVKVGEKIGVAIGELPEEGQDPVAKAVLIGKPGAGDGPGRGRLGGTPTVGTVSSLNGDTLTITTADGDKQVKLPAITSGMRIAVVTAEDGTVRAVMYNPPERPEGELPPEAAAAGTSTTEGTSVS
ncbi:MAG: hypothetical protein HZB44_04655 [Actinobacteria bacterium]|nr:hypothetical protein [Actinomycetota bacterium]